ncbi:MAG TPA: SpoIID/LytB domain-containing protein [Firmicutes bacterium]|nr:SpoIID/LytB domain-containing protein [Bacillota bacterium]
MRSDSLFLFLRRFCPQLLLMALLAGITCQLLSSSERADAAIANLMPLNAPQFQNNWPTDHPIWQQVLKNYNAGELDQTAKLLESLTIASDAAQRLLAWRNLAVIRKDMGDQVAAIAAYRQALLLDPHNGALWCDLGWALNADAQWGEAEEAFEKALAYTPYNVQAMFGLAMAVRERDPQEALGLFQKAVALDDGYALLQVEYGVTLTMLGRYTEAVSTLERALKLDNSYTAVHPILAQLYEITGDVSKAWASYQRAQRTRPNDAALREKAQQFLAQHEKALRSAEQAQLTQRNQVKPTTIVPLETPGAPLIRVGITEGVQQLRMAWGAPLEIWERDRLLYKAPAGTWTFHRQGNRITLRSEDGRTVVTGTPPWQLNPTDPGFSSVVYDLETGQGYFFARLEHRRYRGSFELLLTADSSGMTLVNIVDLESYLLSVVPSEMPASMPTAALEAQAVAARTYTLRSLGRFKSRGFDVSGSVLSSEYRGVDVEHVRTTNAVKATAGVVLKYGSALAETYYTSNSGGYSMASVEIWGGARSYLSAQLDSHESGPEFPLGPLALENWIKGVPKVFSSQSAFITRSAFRWTYVVAASEIEARVNARKDIGRIRKVIARTRGQGGHVLTVDIVGTKGVYTVSGDSIRSMLGGLRSNLFKVETFTDGKGTPTAFVFYGGGFGHGVGLDQYGASGMAEGGYTMSQILDHYFKGTYLDKLY